MRRLVPALTAAALLAFASGVAHAEPSGSPFEIARERVYDLSLAPAGSGRALAHWPTPTGAASRYVGRSGPVGGRFEQIGAMPWTSVSSVGWNSRRSQFLRVWTQPSGADDFSSELWSQVHDSRGAALGQPALIHAPETWSGVWDADVVYDPDARRYLVTFLCCGDEMDPHEVKARLVSEGGAPLGVAVDASDGQRFVGSSHAALRRGGGFLIVWHDTEWGGSPTTIRGQLLTSDGKPTGPDDFLISRHSNLAGTVVNHDPRVAVDPSSGEALVVWSDVYEVFARRISASGRPTGSDLRLSRMGPREDPAWLTRAPDVAYNAAGRQYLVVWQSGDGRGEYPAGEAVYGQHVSRTGAQIGADDFPVATLDRAVEPAVTAVPGSSDFLVAWASHRASPSAWARRIASSR